jgi:hypothetical protein
METAVELDWAIVLVIYVKSKHSVSLICKKYTRGVGGFTLTMETNERPAYAWKKRSHQE